MSDHQPIIDARPALAANRPTELVLHLAGKTYEIPRKFAAENRAWRNQFKASAAPIQALMALAKSMTGDDMQAAIKSLDVADIAAAAESAMPALIGSIDDLTDLLFAYDPALGDNRAAILAGAYDEDLIAAFIKVLQVVYPIKKLTAAYGSGTSTPATT